MIYNNCYDNPNLTLRDIFALQALVAIDYQNYRGVYHGTTSEKIIAQIAYDIADAMLERRRNEQ